MYNFSFGFQPHRILSIIKRFGKHCSCQLQGECVVVGRVRQPYIGQGVGGELDLMVLTVVYKAKKFSQPLHIHPEDGNCNVCRNVG
jgi:hypothetical protein